MISVCLAMLVLLLAAAPAEGSDLRFVELQRTQVGGVQGLQGPQAVTVSADGASVYVASYDGTVAVFRRDPNTGALTFVEVQRDGVGGVSGIGGAGSVVTSRDGAHVYVAGGDDDAVAVFSRDPATGALGFVEVQRNHAGGVTGLNGVETVAVSPDGAHLYAASDVDNAVVVFGRDPATGRLTFVEAQMDDTAGVDGLGGARGVTVSPDGKNVYVASKLDSAVAVFQRDVATGRLAFVEAQREGVGGVGGLGRARAVAVSPDGACVYAAAGTDNALAVFRRDAASGALTFVEAQRDSVGGVDGLGGPQSVTVGPDSTHVYVASDVDDAVAVFARDGACALTFIGMQRDNIGGVDGLDGAHGVSASPDGANVYAVGTLDNAVVVFANLCGDGVLDAGEQCDDGNRRDGDCCSSGCRFEPEGSACSDDGNVCTDDQCDGAGVCEHLNNSAPCDDAQFCTVNDTCVQGVCQGSPRDCSGGADQCNEGVCDEENDRCGVPKADGTPCDDGNACTRTDACTAGRCTGADPVVCAAADPCHEACDPATGACTMSPQPDGTACDDGDACTQSDTCVAGVCTGAPVVCRAQDECHTPGVCDPATGLCSNPPQPDGSSCDDGNACTQSSRCVGGACVGDDPVVCRAQDQCHAQGVCDPATGLCSNPPRPDGSACDDGNACTRSDTCVAGICTGASPVTCRALDACHPGVCDPATGLCSNPPRPDGSACDDGNACTRSDTCVAGICTGADPVVCHAPDECHAVGVCDPATGRCSNPGMPDGTPCGGEQSCTAPGSCSGYRCVAPPLPDRDGDGICDVRDVCPDIFDPDQLDWDHDGVGDACQCDQPPPGRCIAGGGKRRSDCLVEFDPTGPITLNPRRTVVRRLLRCTDGDPACDLDGAADGRCTFGVAVCLANADPRFPRCQPAQMLSLEVLRPSAERSLSGLDQANALALEHGVAALGLEIRRRGTTVSAASTPVGPAQCSPLVHLVTPAPSVPGGKPVRRKFQVRGGAVDGRVDVDRFVLECRR